MIKNESLIANRVSFRELVFVLPSLPLHFFEKWPCVAWIPLTDKASEPSKGQWAVSHTAKRVWAAVVLIWPNTGEVTQNWPVQRGTAWAFVVNLLAVKRSPSGVFLWAFKAATARGTEITSLFNRRVPLQDEEEEKKKFLDNIVFTSSDKFALGLKIQGRKRRGCWNSMFHFHNLGRVMFTWELLEIRTLLLKMI